MARIAPVEFSRIRTEPCSLGSSSKSSAPPSFPFCSVTVTRSPDLRIRVACVARVQEKPDARRERVFEAIRTSAAAGETSITTPRVVMDVSPAAADVRIASKTLSLRASGFSWTRATQATRILKSGDLVTVTLQKGKDGGALLLEEEPREQGSVLILENSTAAIRAMVGGYDWTQSKFNRAVQALRQAGSTFKPFVYLAALEAGYTPSDTVFDGPISIVFDPHQPPYRPSNYDGKFRGIVTFRRALEYSYNVSAVRVSEMVGRAHVIEVAHRLGIR